MLTELARTARRRPRHNIIQVNASGAAAYRFVGNPSATGTSSSEASDDRRRRGGKGREWRHHGVRARPKLRAAPPLMPFMTEELWARLWRRGHAAADVALPRGLAGARLRGHGSADEINWLIDLVSGETVRARGDERAARSDGAAGSGRRTRCHDGALLRLEPR